MALFPDPFDTILSLQQALELVPVERLAGVQPERQRQLSAAEHVPQGR